MGKEKTKLAENQERGLSSREKYVCADCVEDSFLRDVIAKKITQKKCDYCGTKRRKNIAAPVEVILDPIASTFSDYFADPTYADVPYDVELSHTAEDGLAFIGLECHDELFKDIAESIGNDISYVEASGGSWAADPPSVFMTYEWEKFVQTVKHESRFFFAVSSSDRKPFASYKPAEMLAEIGHAVKTLGLIQTWSMGMKLYRGRMRNDDATWPLNSKELGPAPNEKAQAQRMNPAGISYFYLARDRETALAEVVSKPPCKVAMGSFTLCRDLWLLDLANLPAGPSIFDRARHTEYELLSFLYAFTQQISKPVTKDIREHIDYVPSQIVCEYFAKVFKTEEGKSIDGLAYPSSIHPGGINIVLFPQTKKSDCFDELASFSGAEEIKLQTCSELCDAIQKKSGDL